MAAGTKLKVFRTAIGFHDAYVAAPSQKAAMEAWGTDTDLFSRGEAELVTDPALAEAPLASPGTVIKRLRATAAEQIAALDASEAKTPAKKAKATPPRKPDKPRPNRAKLDAAERRLNEARARMASKLDALARREAELAEERRELQKAQAADTAELEQRLDEAQSAFDAAMQAWRD